MEGVIRAVLICKVKVLSRLVTVKGEDFGSVVLVGPQLEGFESGVSPSSFAKSTEIVEWVVRLSKRAYTGLETAPTCTMTGAVGRRFAWLVYARSSHSKGRFGF